jgi:hypothetical protein
MADDKKNPWPMVIFFGLALGLLWLLIDTLKPPAAARAVPVVVDDGSAPPPQALSPTAGVAVTGTAADTPSQP